MQSEHRELSLHFSQTFLGSKNMGISLKTISIALVIGIPNAHAILLSVCDDSKDSSGVYAMFTSND